MNASHPAWARAARVKLMAFDVDGVLTDGSLYYSDAGIETKVFNTRDGHGLRMLQKAGIQLAIITGRRARCVELRMQNLGIDLVYQGVSEKQACLRRLRAEQGIAPEDAGFMGDDVIDFKAMALCGFSAAPADAHDLILRQASLVSAKTGGRGAAREVCEFILAAQGKLDAEFSDYLLANGQ